MDAPRISLGAVNLEAEDPAALASFWATLTGGTAVRGGETAYLIPTSPAGFGMYFQPCGDGPRPRRRCTST